MYYLNTFIIYSFIGFLYENIINLIKGKKIGSGILHGPWTPIYGIGSVLILIIAKVIFKIFKLSKFLEIIIVVSFVTIVLTLIEWISGILIEKIFHTVFWNYSNFKFNIGKYIALEVSLIWAICSLIVIYIIQPIIDRFIYFIPNIITYIIISIIIIDLIYTVSSKKVHK